MVVPLRHAVFANRAAIKEHEAEVREEYENKVRLNQLLHLRASIPECVFPSRPEVFSLFLSSFLYFWWLFEMCVCVCVCVCVCFRHNFVSCSVFFDIKLSFLVFRDAEI